MYMHKTDIKSTVRSAYVLCHIVLVFTHPVYRLNRIAVLPKLQLHDLFCMPSVSYSIGPAKDRSHSADILIPNWSLSRSAAFDIKVMHPLN